jgi:hypothetical protein
MATPRLSRAEYAAELDRRLRDDLAVRHTMTFESKDEIKAAGCMWHPRSKSWLAPDAEIRDRMLALCEAAGSARDAQAALGIEAVREAAAREWASAASAWMRTEGRVERGQVIKIEPGRRGLVVEVERPHYHSADECEDMDCFCRRYGWFTGFTAREVLNTPEEESADRAERERVEAVHSAVQRRTELVAHIRSTGEWPDGSNDATGDELLVKSAHLRLRLRRVVRGW